LCAVQDRIVVTERDRRRIIREWNRQIEAENRRLAANTADGPWKIVVWGALWCVWLGVILGLITWVRPLH
jgi:hypothetical protein